MSTGTNQGWHLIGAEEVRRTWGCFLALVIVQVLLGMMALGWSVLMTTTGLSDGETWSAPNG